MPRIIGVEAHPDFTLTLHMDEGVARRFDCRPYLHRGVFRRLTDVRLFAQAYVAFDTVCWPGELDIAPETLVLGSVELA